MQKLVMLALLLLTLHPAASIAQNSANLSKESLLKDPNILWVAQSEELIVLDLHDYNQQYLQSVGLGDDEWLRCAPLKIQPKPSQGLATHGRPSLSCELFDMDAIEQLNLYKDANCSQKIHNPSSLRGIYLVDSVLYTNPRTQETQKTALYNELNCSRIQTYQVVQLLYFDRRANNFGSLLISFAPVQEMYSPEGKPTGSRKSLFWLKLETLPKPAQLNSDRIHWASQTQKAFEPEDMQVLKSTVSLQECFGLQMQQIRQNYHREELRDAKNPAQKWPREQLQTVDMVVDSVISLHPETFEEVVELKKMQIKEKDLKALCLVQEWYWDHKANQMQVYNLFFAPIINRYDIHGHLLLSVPMYYKPIN